MKRAKKITIAAVIAFIVAAVPFFNDLLDLYVNHVSQKHAEDNLIKMNAGVSIKHVESVFGAPIVESKLKKGLTEYIYSFKRFYLQVVFNKNNNVVFFAVTSKDKRFHPKVPYLEIKLGEQKFNKTDSFKTLYSERSSKYYAYAESHYMGNPGNYRNIYLAHNPAGVTYEKDSQWEGFGVDVNSKAAIEKFRNYFSPNTYGVGDILGEDKDWNQDNWVGIEYFVSRDLPEHNY